MAFHQRLLVELRGFEPLTFSLRTTLNCSSGLFSRLRRLHEVHREAPIAVRGYAGGTRPSVQCPCPNHHLPSRSQTLVLVTDEKGRAMPLAITAACFPRPPPRRPDAHDDHLTDAHDDHLTDAHDDHLTEAPGSRRQGVTVASLDLFQGCKYAGGRPDARSDRVATTQPLVGVNGDDLEWRLTRGAAEGG